MRGPAYAHTERTDCSTALRKGGGLVQFGPCIALSVTDDSRTYVPLSAPLSTASRGSVQIDVRALIVKEPGKPIREPSALHFGRLFVPVEQRGQGLSAAITRDMRALVQSRALAPPLDLIEMVYGQAEPKLSGICASCRMSLD